MFHLYQSNIWFPVLLETRNVAKFWELAPTEPLHISAGNLACDNEAMVCSFVQKFTLMVFLLPMLGQKLQIQVNLYLGEPMEAMVCFTVSNFT